MEMNFSNNNDWYDYLGHSSQLGGTQRLIVDEGKGKGTSIIRIRNGNGLDLTVLPDRGLDIFDIQMDGVQLAWISRNGLVANSIISGGDYGWLRNFGGGLLTTCGLRNVGPPEEDDGEQFGLHGRISGIPARHVNTSERIENGILHIEISGEVSETNVFGENLILHRTYHLNSADNIIEMHDRITNLGSKAEQLMLLYHINWGFPMISPESILHLNPSSVVLRGEVQHEAGFWDKFQKPTREYAERVYFFDLIPDENGRNHYELLNENLKKGVRVSWEKAQLPLFTEWKMMGKGDYVLGLEPGNTLPVGRSATRESGAAEYLESSETKDIMLRFQFIKF